MNQPSLFVTCSIMLFSLDSNTLAQSLCPGSNAAPEKNGILGALQQVGKLVPAASAGAKLGTVDLEAQGLCQYWLYQPEKRQKLIFIDVQGKIQITPAMPMTGADGDPLPGAFVDLPEAITAARKQGMLLPLDSARLRMAQPRGKPAVAVWTLSPKNDPQGRVLSYFISAADAGRTLTVSDVTDYFSDYNVQARRIANLFHPPSAAQPGSTKTTTSPMLGQPCVCWNSVTNGSRIDPVRGVWSVNISFTGIACQLPSFNHGMAIPHPYCE